MRFALILTLFFSSMAVAKVGRVGNGGSLKKDESRVAEGRVGNGRPSGGSIQVDGVEYDLADLHFVPVKYDSYTFDNAIRAEIEKLRDVLEHIGLPLVSKKTGHEFFKDEVYSKVIEYRFVADLPPGCVFMDSRNFANDQTLLNAGCTEGSITYLVPARFAKLSIAKRALLIVHERLHGFAPDEGYDVKIPAMQAFYLLVTKFERAWSAGSSAEIFNADELAKLNQLGLRMHQLSGERECKNCAGKLQFLPTGAVIKSSAETNLEQAVYKVIDPGVTLGAGTVIRVSGFNSARIRGSDFKILGSVIDLGDTQLIGENAQIVDVEIEQIGLWPAARTIRLLPGTQLKNIATMKFDCEALREITFGPGEVDGKLDPAGQAFGGRTELGIYEIGHATNSCRPSLAIRNTQDLKALLNEEMKAREKFNYRP